MPSTANGAATPHVEINIRLRHHNKTEQNCMQTTKQYNKKECQTNIKVYNDGQRAHAAITSRCRIRLTQTDRQQTNR